MISNSASFGKMRNEMFMRKHICRALLLAGLCLVFSGCVVHTGAQLQPDVTLPPAATPTPAVTPTSSPTPAVEAMASAAPIPGVDTRYDALGAYVSDAAHFQQYLSFNMVQVYEQEEDTFLDAIAVNDYPSTLVCAMDVVFYDGEGTEVNRARIQTQDGQYVLRLQPGETVLYAQINTDITLTDMEFALEFNDTLGVLPAS